jgi:hypothetical protein
LEVEHMTPLEAMNALASLRGDLLGERKGDE